MKISLNHKSPAMKNLYLNSEGPGNNFISSFKHLASGKALLALVMIFLLLGSKK